MSSGTNRSRIILAVVFAGAALASAHAVSSYVSQFTAAYPAAAGSPLASCALCHTDINTSTARNPYGSAFGSNSHNFAAIENLDSDGDGFTNIQEISALTFPGNPASKPADTTAPTVTGFAIPGTSSSLTVPITTFTATDNVGVTGYQVTETSGAPSATGGGWSASAPASYTFVTAGAKTLYAWAKDAANNVSASRSASTTIALPPPSDTTAPTVTAFTIPATSSSLTVAISSFTATDNVGVTGYQVTETPGAPSATGGGWSASAPASYTFATAGTKTLYAWAKDAANNVSASRSATTNITLPPSSDNAAPTITSFSIPASSSSLTISVTLTASDNVGVTGYLLTETASTPAATAAGWSSSAPASYTFSTAGAKMLHAWAKDAAGNVSVPRSASTTITLVSGGDTTAPTVTAFILPSTATSLTVSVTSLTATDNIGVTGYLVSESTSKPDAGAAGWKSAAPTSYTFASSGNKTLYGWAKDAAGNVSSPRSAVISITLPGDSDMSIWVGRWFKVKLNRDGKGSSWKDSDDDSEVGSSEIGYLKIRSWDPALQTLQSSLFYRNGRTGPWASADLPLHFTGGGPQRFLFWFEYAQEFQFAAGMIGGIDRGVLMRANFSAAGVYLLKNEDELGEDVNIALIISGKLLPEWQVPPELLDK